MSTAASMERIPSKWPRPVWRPPWKNYRVISGHLGWVRSVAVDPSNTWFCIGSADRTIKVIMEACGSGTGGVVTISSTFKLLFSLGHWRVRLAFMLSPMMLLVWGLSLAKQTRPLRCGKRMKLPPLKPFRFISSHLKISRAFSGTFSLVSSFVSSSLRMHLLVVLLVGRTNIWTALSDHRYSKFTMGISYFEWLKILPQNAC